MSVIVVFLRPLGLRLKKGGKDTSLQKKDSTAETSKQKTDKQKSDKQKTSKQQTTKQTPR